MSRLGRVWLLGVLVWLIRPPLEGRSEIAASPATADKPTRESSGAQNLESAPDEALKPLPLCDGLWRAAPLSRKRLVVFADSDLGDAPALVETTGPQNPPPQPSGPPPISASGDSGANPNLKPGPASQTQGKHRHPHLIEVTRQNWHPLSSSEKFELFWRDLIYPETHLSLAGAAGFSYMTNDRSYLGRGWKGYFSRYGLNAADEANGTLVQAFLLPTLFHEDPRYLPLESGTIRQRLMYALSRVLVTRNDAGAPEWNKSKILGSFASSALSNVYNHDAQRNISPGATVTRAVISIGSDAAFNTFKEFWPDFARKIKLNLWIEHIVRASIRDAIKVD